jgi:hypothetical protein
MDAIDELFKETNVLAEKFRKSGRVKISPPPQRKEKKKRDANIHRYGPEDRPPSLSEVSERICEKISTAPEREALAFCVKCNCDVPMKWKPKEKCGKDVKSWFVCAICACDRLGIKYLHK